MDADGGGFETYAGRRVRLAFYHTADDHVAPGWYIDLVEIWHGIPAFRNPETFESGWGDWYAENGVWQVGTPTSGPEQAYEGTSCAATGLWGNYPVYTDSRLISPEVTLPTVSGAERVQLRFWQ